MIIGKRNIKVEPSEFKGKIYVSIREWYTPEGSDKELPGKKGINLTIEEWDEMVEKLEEIKQEIDQARV